MTYKPDRNYSGVDRITLDDLQTIHTAAQEALKGLGDAQFALRDLLDDLLEKQDWLKRRAVRSLLDELDNKETALDKALRGDTGLETEIGVVTLMSETKHQPVFFRGDIMEEIERQAGRRRLFSTKRNPKTAAMRFAAAVLKSLDVNHS